MSGEHDLERLLVGAEPARRPGEFVVVSVDDPSGLSLQAMVVEDEGCTYVVPRHEADARGLEYDLVCAWITMTVHSALDAVGFTAAFSAALAEAGIPANVLAGLRHDHVLVPVERVDDAIAVLEALSRR